MPDESLEKIKKIAQTRVIKFSHNIKTPVGKSVARGTKFQTLYQFPNSMGFILDCRIDCEGVHTSDCFYVEERWIIQPSMNGKVTPKADKKVNESVLLTTKFELRFVKKTLWKSVIESMTSAETRKWFQNYGTMLQESLAGGETNENCKNETSGSHHGKPIEKLSSSWTTELAIEKRISTFLIYVVIMNFLMVLIFCAVVFLFLQNQWGSKLISMENELMQIKFHIKDMENELQSCSQGANFCMQQCQTLAN